MRKGGGSIRLTTKRSDLVVALGIEIPIGADGKLATEVRLFKRGENMTEKGVFLFDELAAELVMSHQESMGGVDRMVDLEHLSLDPDSPNYDPDARGWCRLEVRNGELWAVDIRWAQDGVERLTARKQRYLSPAFPTDGDERITKIVNIALTALPATHDAVALVAANARGKKMHPKIVMLRTKLEQLKKLAADSGDGGDAPAGKAAAAQAALKKCIEACQAAEDAFGGNDIDATFAAVDAALAAMADAEAAMKGLSGGGGGNGGDMQPAATSAAEPTAEQTSATLRALSVATGKTDPKEAIAEVTRLRNVAIAHEAELERLAAETKVLEAQERRQLVGELVKLGHETPATAWADDDGKVPAEPWASMKIEALRKRVEKLTGIKRAPGALQHPPMGGDGRSPITQTSTINVDEFEINRLKATLKREMLGVPKERQRDFDYALALYREVREAQLAGAELKGRRDELKRLAGPMRADCVLLNASGQLVKLASPVQPIQEFGPSSQRALEEFRLEYNATLASQPIPWAERIGVVLPGGSLKDTYPLAFYAIKFRELTAQGAPATNPNSVDVTVNKREFAAAATAELRRIARGDFAYIQQWGNTAAVMARARVNLRNHLVADLLEENPVWGVTKDQPNGIDGQNFFDTAHKVNPFDPKMKFHGSATWGNEEASGSPLNAPNLTKEKASMLLVPGPDGEEMGTRATGMIVPTVLDETARLLLTVQDLILLEAPNNDAAATVRNEHFMSGFEYVWAPQLAGTDPTADYYVYSMETISRGLPPWVLAEDATEEVRVWDENSDHYKNTGFIKTQTHALLNAALLYPHGIRHVNGS